MAGEDALLETDAAGDAAGMTLFGGVLALVREGTGFLSLASSCIAAASFC